MIVGGSSLDEEYLSRIDHAIPAVLVNSCSHRFSISVDQSLGAHKAMTHLLELGHRQIVYVSQGIYLTQIRCSLTVTAQHCASTASL